MHPSSRNPLVVLAAALALVLALGCATTGVNRGDLNLVSYEQEWQLGQQLERDLAGQLRLVNDRRAVGYLDQIGQRVVRQTELAQVPWEFHLVANPEINAFNIPGGHVYVNTGLVAATGSPSELAAVIGHEVAHGVARHGTEQLTRVYGLNILAALALGDNPSLYQQLLAQIVGGGAIAKFGRDAERESDGLGIRYMHAAGYDPRGMVSLFERLLRARQRQPGRVQQFFSTHPLTEQRIADARRAIAGLPARERVADEGGWGDFQRRAADHGR
jgi:predicted Zn-dependent protease